MNKKLLRNQALILGLLITSSCTVMQPRTGIENIADHCEDKDCVIKALDKTTDDPAYPGERFKMMDGYSDTKLAPMLEDGRLDIEYINPIFVALGPVFGYARIIAGKYGEVLKCSIRVIPWVNWSFLIHELTHCQGYKDRGYLNPFWFMDTYTKAQNEIIERENVANWTSTQFYQQKSYITADYIFNNEPKS